MIRLALSLAALLTLAASAFAADPAPTQSAKQPQQNAALPRDAAQTRNPAAVPAERQAELDEWRASRQAALHYCFDPCIEPKKPAF